MSAEAIGWVWKNSPYRGAELLVHLAIGDVVNDAHDNEFWMSTGSLAKKAKVSRSTATATLADMLRRGLLTLVESGAAQRRPSTYRFRMPSAVGGLVTSAATDTTSAIQDDALARSAVTELNRDNPRTQAEEFSTRAAPKIVERCSSCHRLSFDCQCESNVIALGAGG